MVTVGMLHWRSHPKRVKKAYAHAAVAKMEDIGFYYFSPEGVDFKKQIVTGYVYENGDWHQKEMPFPDVIYNASDMKTDPQIEVYRKLKNRIPFTSHPVGNKMRVYKRIEGMPEFADYLIPSIKINHPDDVFEAVAKYGKVIMKPVAGSQGIGILYIEQNAGKFNTIFGAEHKTLEQGELTAVIQTLVSEKDYLIQPYISCRTKDGNPYDFRLHVQKGGSGEWGITVIYPRIGSKETITSNISRGGSIGTLGSFLKREFGEESYNMRKTLKKFAERFTAQFEELYDWKFDELGIDIGIDENNKLWIFEVNWRPGQGEWAFEMARNLLPYAVHLANQNKD